jgi:hypothetical protein
MAKSQGKTGGTNSKIRFIMLEADLADGDLTQITQAITQAVRQGPPVARQTIAIPARAGTPATETPEPVDETDDDAITDVDGNGNGGEPVAKTRTPRKPIPVKVLDVDLNSGDVPFEKFAKEKGPQATLSRHLVAAYWFKKYRNLDGITADHAFTCYKKMSWGTVIRDFAQPFRDIARAGRGAMKKGVFTINHIGEDVVEKMTPE